MYAVIRSGGKQYAVTPGSTIAIERLEGKVGDPVVFNEVLAVIDEKLHGGQPVVENATVCGTIVAQERAKKIVVFKKKRRKNYRRTKGHRQLRTRCKIHEIRLGPPLQDSGAENSDVMVQPSFSGHTNDETGT